MHEIELSDIKALCNSDYGKKIKERVKEFVGSDGKRKRPRCKEEQRILDSFKRK